MINGLQIFVHLPLLKTIFPANANLVMDELSSFATFDILPTDTYLGWLLTFPDDYEDEVPQTFVQSGYDSRYTVELLGSVFLFMLIFTFVLVLLVFLIVITYLCKCNRLEKLKFKIKKWILWNPIFRLILEGCLEMAISV